MKRILKKMLVLLFAVVLIISCSFFMVSCTNGGRSTFIPEEPQKEESSADKPVTETGVTRNDVKISESSFDGKTFPFIYVDIENNAEVTSKEEYLSCVVRITNTDEEYVFDGENAKTAKIKGRGNSSWKMPKKSYKLKFDKKVDVFGFGKAKKWTLIANYADRSLSRNLMAYRIANAIGLTETTSTQPVNLMINGDYYGVYLLCEQNEIGENRVDIESNLQDIDTGYLLEFDQHASNEGTLDVDFFIISREHFYTIKDPETDDANFTRNHFDFIKNYVTDCYVTLEGNNYEQVKKIIDVESFAKCYLIQELFNNSDLGESSFFFYKVKSGKLFAGPLWDFDISSGNGVNYTFANDPDFLYAKYISYWFKKLTDFSEFKDLIVNFIYESKNVILKEINDVFTYQMQYIENNNLNFDVWQNLGLKIVWPYSDEVLETNDTYPVEISAEVTAIDTFQGQLEYLKTWLEDSLTYMLSVYSPEIPYGEEKDLLDIANINILNMPTESQRVSQLLTDCLDEEIEFVYFPFELIDVYNFLKENNEFYLDVVDSNVILSSDVLTPEMINEDGYSFCIVEVKINDLKDLSTSIKKLYWKINHRKLIVAIIGNEELNQTFRYNFLYK